MTVLPLITASWAVGMVTLNLVDDELVLLNLCFRFYDHKCESDKYPWNMLWRAMQDVSSIGSIMAVFWHFMVHW